MTRFPDITLETAVLNQKETATAGDAIRHLDESPAWFRLQQMLHKEKARLVSILKDRPSTKNHVDYAEVAGALQQIDKFDKYFDTIAKEAIAAHESN